MKTNTDKSAADDSPDAMRSWESEKQSAYLYRVMREVEPDTTKRELFTKLADEARALAGKLLENPEHALDTLAREELGLNPDELGSPWGAASFSFLAFGAGGIVPLLPFLFGAQANAILLATALGLAGLFAVGAALSLFTGRAALWSGLRMVLIGGSAALTTYLIGKWLGVSLS